MTHTEFKKTIMLIGWTQRGAARMMGVGETSVREWANGKRQVPESISNWLLVVSKPFKDYPSPRTP